MPKTIKPQVGDSIPAEKPNYMSRKQAATWKALEEAYASHQRGEPGSMTRLLELVRKFLYAKMYAPEIEFKAFGTAKTVDDWVQERWWKVYQDLRDKKIRTSFSGYLSDIAYYGEKKFIKYLKKERETNVKLEVPVGVDAYTGEADPDAETENYAIYYERKDPPKTQNNFVIPRELLNDVHDSVVRSACILLMEKKSINSIAAEYGMTREALLKRFYREEQRRKKAVAAKVDELEVTA